MDPEKADVTALTGVENSHFPAIREWICNFLHDESEVRDTFCTVASPIIIDYIQFFMAADEDDRNSVVVKVLQLLTVLIKYGYYDDASDVNVLLPSIYKFLDGNQDFPSKQIKHYLELSLKDEIHRREFWVLFMQLLVVSIKVGS